nr:signal peptidase I [Deinococcus sp. RIT780]
MAFALLLTQFGATAVRVDGVSMLPSLRHGETLFVPKIEGWAHTLGAGTYARGDTVVFKPPRTATQEWTRTYRGLTLPWAYRPYLVKRVIGLPGDTVQVQAGTVLVNGRPLNKSFHRRGNSDQHEGPGDTGLKFPGLMGLYAK